MRLTEFAADSEKAMQACNSDVIEPRYPRAEGLGGDCRLFGDAQIACAGTEDSDATVGLRGQRLAQREDLRHTMICGLRVRDQNKLCGLFAHVGREDIDAGGDEAREDRGRLVCRLAASVDDLRKTGAQTPMMIDARVTEIFKRQRGKT